MTPSLQLLQNTRKQTTADQVETEYMRNKDEKMPKANNNTVSGLNLTVEEQIGLKREKSTCLLLNSQIALMFEIFKEIDTDHLDI